MKVGIIGAMAEEILYFQEHFDVKEEIALHGLTFYAGKCGNTEVVFVKSGIGKVCAAAAAVLLIEHFKCECLINSGVAGGIYTGFKAADLVLGETLAYHDADVTAFGYQYGQLPGHDLYFKADPKLLQKAKELRPKAYQGLIVSADMFVADSSRIAFIKEHFPDAMSVEMEGAAVAQVGADFKVPFLVIRGISDGANEEGAKSIEENLMAASEACSSLVYDLICAL